MFTLGTPWQSSESNPPEVRVQSMVKEAKSKEQRKYIFLYQFLKNLFSYDLGLKFSKTRY